MSGVIDRDAYLARLGYTGDVATTAVALQQLQLAHLYTVPFENLSIYTPETIQLNEAWLFDKVVQRRRGGFCYELNGLFALLLRDLGFNVELLSAEVADSSGGFAPPFDHMALMVMLDEPWLVDVGFGDTFRHPLRLDMQTEQPQNGRSYQIAPDGDYLLLKERKPGGDWRPQYRFTTQPHPLADFAPRCHFQQTSPDSHFTKGRLCTLATENGRITLAEKEFVATTLPGQRHSQPVTDEAHFRALLHQHFDLDWSNL